eukprot:SAG11_NODE_25569_length_357_cov_0.596899_1_plen_37_part_10
MVSLVVILFFLRLIERNGFDKLRTACLHATQWLIFSV